MDLGLFAKSALLGLAIAAPLGPIGVLCISRTLSHGFVAGMAGGPGTALADAVYATLAAFGFAAFSSTLALIDTPLRLVGGGFMLWLGFVSLKPAAEAKAAAAPSRSLFGTTATTFFLTIANPMTILAFAALFAGLGLAERSTGFDAVWVVSGVFAGSMIWWGMLSGAVAIARHKLSDQVARWVAKGSGLILMTFGVWAIASAVFQ